MFYRNCSGFMRSREGMMYSEHGVCYHQTVTIQGPWEHSGHFLWKTNSAIFTVPKIIYFYRWKKNISLTFTQSVVFKPQSLRQGFACTCLTEKRMTEPKQGRRSSLETLWSQQEVGPCKVLQRALAVALLSLYSLQTRGQSFKWSHQLVLDCKLQDET